MLRRKIFRERVTFYLAVFVIVSLTISLTVSPETSDIYPGFIRMGVLQAREDRAHFKFLKKQQKVSQSQFVLHKGSNLSH